MIDWGTALNATRLLSLQTTKPHCTGSLARWPVDVIATDHAPPLTEKEPPYEHAHAGPSIGAASAPADALYLMWKNITGKIVEKMSHAVATCFNIRDRGFIKRRLLCWSCSRRSNQPYTVTTGNILTNVAGAAWRILLSRQRFVIHSWAGMVYGNNTFDESVKGKRLSFNR